jgi:hypothetical protein
LRKHGLGSDGADPEDGADDAPASSDDAPGDDGTR